MENNKEEILRLLRQRQGQNQRQETDRERILRLLAEKRAQQGGAATVVSSVPETTATQENNDRFFKAGAFSDGYQFGDVIKTILGTAGDVGVNAVKGAGSLVEGATDLLGYAGAGVADLVGADEFASDWKKSIQKNTVDAILKGAEDRADKASVLGGRSDAISQGLGQVAAIILTGGAASAAGTAAGLSGSALKALTSVAVHGVNGLSTMGSSMSQAYQEGATDGEAVTYGTIAGTAEVISSMLFAGMGKSINALGFSKGLFSADDILAKKLSSKISSQLGKNLVELGVKAGAEGTEEVLSGIAQAFGKKLTYMSEEDLGKIVKDERLFDQFLTGAITSGIAQSGIVPGMKAGSFREATKAGRDMITGLTQNEQKVVDKVVADRVAERKKTGELSKKEEAEIYDKVLEDMENGRISIDTIESVLGGDTYKGYRSLVEQEKALTERQKALQREIDALQGADNTIGNNRKLQKAESELEEVTEKLKSLDVKSAKSNLFSEVDKLTAKDTKLRESYNERTRRGQAFTADLSQYDEKLRPTIQRAIDNGEINNTRATHAFVEGLAKIEAEKGIGFDFTNNERLAELGLTVAGRNVGGYVDGTNVTLNLSSSEALNKVVGHEVTHVFEGSGQYDALMAAMKEFAVEKGIDWDARVQEMAERYKNIKNADPEKELLADLVGEYLFTDSGFMESLSTKNPGLFKKIFEEIKFLAKTFAGTKQGAALEKVKKTFAELYREADIKNTAQTDGVRYALESKTQQGKLDPRTVTKDDVLALLRQVEDGSISGNTYIPLRIGTPQILIYWADKRNGDTIDNNPIAISADKAHNAMNRNGETSENGGRPNRLTADEIVAMVENMNDPEYIVYQGGNDRYVEVVKFNRDNGDSAFAVLEIGNNKDAVYMNGYEGGLYNILVTTYPPITGKLKELLNGSQNKVIYDKKKDASQRTSSSTVPSVLNDASFYEDIISEPSAGVKEEKAPSPVYSLGRNEQGTAPAGGYRITGEDIALAPTREDIARMEQGIATAQKAPRNDMVDKSSHISLEDYANNESPVWRNVAYNDDATKASIMQSTHDAMVAEGAVVAVTQDVIDTVEQSFPDLRSMKKKDRTPILKEAINKLKSNIRQFLTGLSNQNFEFEVNGKVLDAKLYSTGINEVLEKVTQEKANMLFSTEEIFRNARYLYSTPDYDGDPNVYRWNYFYTPVQIGDETVGVRIAVRDMVKGTDGATPESQIYNWGIKKDASLDGGSHDPRAASSDVSSDASTNNIPEDMPGVKYSVGESAVEEMGAPTREDIMRMEAEKELHGPWRMTDELDQKVEKLYRMMLREEVSEEDYIAQLVKADKQYQQRGSKVEEALERVREAYSKETTETPETEKKMERLTRKVLHKGIMDRIRDALAKAGFDLNTILKNAKNLSTFATVDNTPQRVNEKTFGYKAGQVINDLTVNKAALNESDGIQWLNGQIDKIKKMSERYGIKPGSKESRAAQIYGEGFWVNEVGEYIQYGDAELAADFPDTEKQAKIKALAKSQEVRQMYDDTLDAINAARVRNGYPAIPRRDNYFLHFRAQDDTFSRIGVPFNPNDVRAKDLPTDLNGVTADLKPGKPFFASEMHRTGDKTTYDLLGGLERYMNSAKNQIYHIDDIQTFRAMRNYIADMFGQANGLADLDSLSPEEQEQRIKEVFDNHLSTYAKFLNEEANIFAGKTALIDRGVEGVLGRRAIQFLHTLNGQVGKNMVGYNISSAGTNVLPVVQATAMLPKADMVKAFAQTISNKFRSDGFVESDPALIRRKGADQFAKTPWQRISDPGYALMSAVDNLSSELIVRAKYNELTRKGMDSQQAHIRAGEWASRLMGDRSLGQMPQLYNSKTLGLITKFQLEVRNQLDAMGYDVIQEAKAEEGVSNAKKAAKVASTMAQLAIFQHLFGQAYEAIAGYNPAFDIVENLIKLFGFDDEEESEDTVGDNVEQAFLGFLEDLPYTSTFTGGRIPISSALPVKEVITGKDSYGNDKDRWETLAGALPYYVLPGGYGQIKKTTQGIKMFDEDLPVAGSYTESGNLRFPVEEDSIADWLQAALFGQYASKNAREYFDNGWAPLKEKQIEEFASLGIPIADYREIRKQLGKLETTADKVDYIGSLDLTVEQKNILVNNVVDRKEPVDMTDYDMYEDFDEFDFYIKNQEKYQFLKDNGIAYKTYKASEESREAYNWAFQNPEKYQASRAVTEDTVTYKSYTKALSEIKADKDSAGNAVSGSRKKKVVQYINGLDAEYGAKLVLYKMEYPSDDTYNEMIIQYVNGVEGFTFEQKANVLKELGFIVSSDGKVSWN